jgi:hypothetical protein
MGLFIIFHLLRRGLRSAQNLTRLRLASAQIALAVPPALFTNYGRYSTLRKEPLAGTMALMAGSSGKWLIGQRQLANA